MDGAIRRLKVDVQYRPADPHPSDWFLVEAKEPPPWALQEFMHLPDSLIDLVDSDVRGPLIPSSFATRITPLEKAYFSIQNRDFIMDRILDVMFRLHNIRLTRQSNVALLGLMTNVYNDNVRDMQKVTPASLLFSVGTLDALVLEQAIHIMTREYRDYVRDRKYFEKPATWISDIPLPQHTSIKNEFPLSAQPAFLTKFPLPRPGGMVADTNLSTVGTWPGQV